VAGLFAWAEDESTGLAASIERALDVVDTTVTAGAGDA